MLIKKTDYLLPLLAVFTITSGCSTIPLSNTQQANTQPSAIQHPSIPDSVDEIHPGILKGYLNADEIPNSLTLVPEPPAIGSIALALDEDVSQKSIKLQGTPRWALAAKDAKLAFPDAANTFSCALDIPINQEDTPHLYMLLRRTLTDAGLSTYGAKNHYQRPRPFVINNKPMCSPHEEQSLRKDGSYPSGHTAIGWAWALILTEISPEQSTAILARGREYGQSRVICNVHWQSDVNEGRIIGAAAVASLHSNPVFRAELAAVKQEISTLRANNITSVAQCDSQ